MNEDRWWKRGDKAYVEVEIDCDEPDSDGDAYVRLPGGAGASYVKADTLQLPFPPVDPRIFDNPQNIEKFLEA